MFRLWVFIAGSIMLAPSAVSAHAYLVKSVPAQRAVLYRAPAKIELWFNERLESRYSSLSVSDADGKPVATGAAEIAADDPKRLSVAVKPLPPGRYTIRFRVLSVDGHVAQDQFSFTIKQ
jgi:methionine-rich copper-binding protein CopC